MNNRFRISREDDLINKSCAKMKHADPSRLRETLPPMLCNLKSEHSELYQQINEMSIQLTHTERRLLSIEHRTEYEKKKFRDQLDLLFFNYLPSTTNKKYSQSLGPVDNDLFETDHRVGDYHIGKLLGDGHYANVYVGTNHGTGEKYALKKLRKERLVSLNKVLQLQQELDVLRFVKHPNIIEMHDVIHGPSNIYILLELSHGDLGKYLCDNAHGLTLDTVREIAVGVLHGMQHLHGCGIAHLDIKVENVLVSTHVDIAQFHRSHIKICDLGMVQVQADPSKEIPVPRVAGTPGYFAPELILDLKSAEGRRADMWSFGALLVEVTETLSEAWINAYSHFRTSKRKFESGIIQCLMDFYHKYSFPDFELHDLIVRCLCIEHKQRLTASEALNHVWIERKYDPNEDEDTVWHHRHTL